MRSIVLSLLLLASGSAVMGQDRAVSEVLRRFGESLPDRESLAFYSLDWACSLKEAKERARAENRPILLILNTNITAHCNFYSGHT